MRCVSKDGSKSVRASILRDDREERVLLRMRYRELTPSAG
jgi:hypothetical protein